MRIIFVRHGHPNYEKDCLTDLGHKHAEAAALRLKNEGIEAIYSSTCGRAFETAQHLGDVIGLPVTGLDFMREISWGPMQSESLAYDGHPWSTTDQMVSTGDSILEKKWATREPFAHNKVVGYVQRVGDALDAWLATLGYTREGLYYRTGQVEHHTIAAFGHGGETAAVLCRLFNLAFPFTCAAMGPDYTGITIVEFPERPGELVTPRFELMNDARHIKGLTVENYYGK